MNGSVLQKTMNNLLFYYREGNPKTVYFAITNDCNSSCSTCRFPKETEKRYVSLSDAINAIDFLHENGVRFVSITGGEPFLHPDLMEICRHIDRKGMKVTYIPTNGKLITDAVAKELSGFYTGIIGISIDPDHDDRTLHTRSIALDVIRNARTALEERNLKTYAGVLLTAHSLPISKCIGAARSLGFKRIVFSFPQVSESSPYFASADIDDLRLSANFARDMVAQIKDAKRNFSIYNFDDTLDDFERSYTGDAQRHPCTGGSRMYYVDWDLKVYKCFSCPESYGRIGKLQDLPVENGTCTNCTQQAFRDMSYLFGIYDAFHAIKGSVLDGMKYKGPVSIREHMKNFSVLLQLYRGGFI